MKLTRYENFCIYSTFTSNLMISTLKKQHLLYRLLCVDMYSVAAYSLVHSYHISLNTSCLWIVPASILSLTLNEIVDPFASDEELENDETIVDDKRYV